MAKKPRSSLKRSRQRDRSKSHRENRKANAASGQVIWFGQHKGTLWLEMPDEYITWLCSSLNDGPEREAAMAERCRRQDLSLKDGDREDQPQPKPIQFFAPETTKKRKSTEGSARGQKQSHKDWAETHYTWTGPTGIVDWIPKSIDMDNRDGETPPF
ncbi:MAG: hypothetical protein ABGZ53_26650 [Fuerstiella sp.]